METPEKILKTFCSTLDAAKILGVSQRTVQLWAENGLLEAWKTRGGHRRITRASIDHLLLTPVFRPGGEAPKRGKRVAEEPRPFSVLVVEDDAALRRLYEINLARWPLQPKVSIAGDGYEALIRLGQTRPDFLITDLNMPGMDGFRMLKAIRNIDELVDMAIVVVTGLDPAEVASRGGVSTNIRVFPKPVPFAELQAIAARVSAARMKR